MKFLLMLLKEKKKHAYPVMGSREEGAGAVLHLPVCACQVGPIVFFTLFSTLCLISIMMPSRIKVRDSFTKLQQRITRDLK